MPTGPGALPDVVAGAGRARMPLRYPRGPRPDCLPLMAACPCNPTVTHAQCCGPLHAGATRAANAEALMRSRYSAYVLGDAAYLLATWHPSTRPATLAPDDAGTRWLGLAVRQHAATGTDAGGRATATVEFVARYRTGGGRAVRLHELSRFVREDGAWSYLDGSFPAG